MLYLRSSNSETRMSQTGQKHRFDSLPTTSGLPPLATQLRTSRIGSFGPRTDMLTKRFREFVQKNQLQAGGFCCFF
jgi:hypothetical protein